MIPKLRLPGKGDCNSVAIIPHLKPYQDSGSQAPYRIDTPQHMDENADGTDTQVASIALKPMREHCENYQSASTNTFPTTEQYSRLSHRELQASLRSQDRRDEAYPAVAKPGYQSEKMALVDVWIETLTAQMAQMVGYAPHGT